MEQHPSPARPEPAGAPPGEPAKTTPVPAGAGHEPDAGPTGALPLEVDPGDGGKPLTLRGEVDARTAPELRERLRKLVEAGGQRVVLDVKDLDFKDWTGLGVLVGARKRLREAGGDLVLRSPTSDAATLLERSGMHEVFIVEE
ncbi:MAG: anti-sigma factor antagonist [Actinomycetota bacterium]|nr:anti-sigma factor antagonist [Actinomycetota bacterium]